MAIARGSLLAFFFFLGMTSFVSGTSFGEGKILLPGGTVAASLADANMTCAKNLDAFKIQVPSVGERPLIPSGEDAFAPLVPIFLKHSLLDLVQNKHRLTFHEGELAGLVDVDLTDIITPSIRSQIASKLDDPRYNYVQAQNNKLIGRHFGIEIVPSFKDDHLEQFHLSHFYGFQNAPRSDDQGYSLAKNSPGFLLFHRWIQQILPRSPILLTSMFGTPSGQLSAHVDDTHFTIALNLYGPGTIGLEGVEGKRFELQPGHMWIFAGNFQNAFFGSLHGSPTSNTVTRAALFAFTDYQLSPADIAQLPPPFNRYFDPLTRNPEKPQAPIPKL